MKIPTQQTISKEEIPDSPDWADVLMEKINTLMNNFYPLVNKNVDFSNLACQTKVIPFRTPSTYPTSMDPIKFLCSLKKEPIGCSILQCINVANNQGVETNNPGWNYINGSIVIPSISGLTASTSYEITFYIV